VSSPAPLELLLLTSDRAETAKEAETRDSLRERRERIDGIIREAAELVPLELRNLVRNKHNDATDGNTMFTTGAKKATDLSKLQILPLVFDSTRYWVWALKKDQAAEIGQLWHKTWAGKELYDIKREPSFLFEGNIRLAWNTKVKDFAPGDVFVRHR